MKGEEVQKWAIDDNKKKKVDEKLAAGEVYIKPEFVDKYAKLLTEDLKSTAETELHILSDPELQTTAKEGLWTLQGISKKRYRYNIWSCAV